LPELRKKHRNEFVTEEANVHSFHTEPTFAIGQRAFLICTPEGNVLWDCLTLIDEETVSRINSLGGIRVIAISHPHYYTTMVEWSARFGGIPIYIHQADRSWNMRPGGNLNYWSGESLPLWDGLTLIHTPGHFEGFQVLHWRGGADGRGALFCGDQPQVCMDTRWVSFMYSYPNLIPLRHQAVRRILEILDRWKFERLYGAFPKRSVTQDARERLARSAERYFQAV
jgi:hypothetical protein